jgi:glycopeptide antibiotics resistance protein
MTWLGRAWQKRRGLALDVAPAVLALACMFWLGLVPIDSLPGPDFELADKMWHFIAFGGLTALLARALCYFGRAPLVAAREATAASAALGGMLEVLQSFTRYRSADLGDLLADTLGALAAYLVLRALSLAAAKDLPA